MAEGRSAAAGPPFCTTQPNTTQPNPLRVKGNMRSLFQSTIARLRVLTNLNLNRYLPLNDSAVRTPQDAGPIAVVADVLSGLSARD